MRSIRRACGVVVLFLAAADAEHGRRASAAPAVSNVSVGTADPGVVYRGDRLVPFLRAMRTGRVDIAGVGDSNQLYGGTYGHDHGQQKAWSDRVGLYGTGVLPLNPTGGWPAAGYVYGGGGLGTAGAAPPPAFAPVALGGDGFPAYSSLSLGEGESVAANATRLLLQLPVGNPLGVTGELRWHTTVGQVPASTPGAANAQFRPSARYNSTATVVASTTVPLVSADGTFRLADAALTIPADPTRSQDLWVEPTTLFQHDLRGPFFAQWQRTERTDRAAGVAYSALLYQGGQSTRAAARSLADAPDAALAEYLRQATRLQDARPGERRLMVQVIQGGNDRLDPTPAVGSTAPTNTPEGYRANLAAIVGRLRAVWAAAGYDPARLNFVVGAYHAQDEFRGQFAAFEAAAMSLADATPGVTVIRGTRMLSGTTMRANGWYDPAGGEAVAHLSPGGFEGVGRLTVNQMLSLVSDGTALRSDVSSVALALTEDPSALRPGDLHLQNLTTGAAVSAADVSVDYDAAARVATFTFPGLDGDVLPRGRYEATFQTAGAGDPYTFGFAAVPEPAGAAVVGLVPAGGLLARRRRGPGR